MGKFAVAVTGFVVGVFTYAIAQAYDIEKGDVVYECDDYYVKSSKSKTFGWCNAEVRYKNPKYNENEEEA